MDKEINHRTTRDALIHDLLGDVGALHDKVKELPASLQTSLKESLAPTLGAAVIAAQDLRKSLDASNNLRNDAQVGSFQQMQEDIRSLLLTATEQNQSLKALSMGLKQSRKFNLFSSILMALLALLTGILSTYLYLR